MSCLHCSCCFGVWRCVQGYACLHRHTSGCRSYWFDFGSLWDQNLWKSLFLKRNMSMRPLNFATILAEYWTFLISSSANACYLEFKWSIYSYSSSCSSGILSTIERTHKYRSCSTCKGLWIKPFGFWSWCRRERSLWNSLEEACFWLSHSSFSIECFGSQLLSQWTYSWGGTLLAGLALKMGRLLVTKDVPWSARLRVYPLRCKQAF